MSDPAIKLFGKTIPLPLASEEGGEDYNCKTSPLHDETKDEDLLKSEGKHEPITSTVADETRKPSSDDDSSNPREKPLKKPNKILPCPRCNSMDTKFCYYNNYNVSQPRHFCKNCQRYWTAGGTMRNVPVGSGRRKNKNSAYGHLTVSDAALPAALTTNGTVLSFGSDTPICESMASVLNCSRDEVQSTGCSATHASNCDSTDDGYGVNLQEPVIQNYRGLGPYCWSPAPMQFHPAPAYWGCGNWSMPWFAPQLPPPSPTMTSPISSGCGPLSPTLGKHSREGNVKQGNLWIPKTLRIDDPEEAAKSSIWATMGFNKDKDDSISSRGLFKAFATKAELNDHNVDANSPAFHANPAALSRSINFQESS